MMRRLFIVTFSCLALSACSSEQHSDLRQFVKDSDSTIKPGRIPSLPEVKPYEPFEYAAYDLIDPFVPRKIEAPKASSVPGALQPPKDHVKGPLEAFPLENLKMVGTLQQKKDVFALIKTPDNNLYRVKAGDYLGQNFGRITDINESALKLKELVQDSGSEWKEEERTLLLQE